MGIFEKYQHVDSIQLFIHSTNIYSKSHKCMIVSYIYDNRQGPCPRKIDIIIIFYPPSKSQAVCAPGSPGARTVAGASDRRRIFLQEASSLRPLVSYQSLNFKERSKEEPILTLLPVPNLQLARLNKTACVPCTPRNSYSL